MKPPEITPEQAKRLLAAPKPEPYQFPEWTDAERDYWLDIEDSELEGDA